MARNDLLIALVQAGAAGDKRGARIAAEALIAEERAKQHNVLADRLAQAIHINNNGLNTVSPVTQTSNQAKDFITDIVPRRKLSDLILNDNCLENVNQLIEEQQRASLLRAHNLDPRHRILLVGPPGNGKTSLAECIAEALAVPFFVVRYETMIGSFLGETAGRLKRVFDYARTTPCVLFFDEFDAVGKERGDIHETGEIKRVVTSLLMQIDDLPSYTVIVAATNHAELLDRAVWRRFQIRLNLPQPTTKELIIFFERFISSLKEWEGLHPAKIVRDLGPTSYAEAEQFTLDVRRRWVLSMYSVPLTSIIKEQLFLWKNRAHSARAHKKETTDARKASPIAAKATKGAAK